MSEMSKISKNNKIKVKLHSIPNKDKDGNIIKDASGEETYIRHDANALAQMMDAVNSKAVPTTDYTTVISLSDKSLEAAKHQQKEIELSFAEANLLKTLLENPGNLAVSYPTFYIRTIDGILEQLK